MRPEQFVNDTNFFGVAQTIAGGPDACPLAVDQAIRQLVEHDILPLSVKADVIAAHTEQAASKQRRMRLIENQRVFAISHLKPGHRRAIDR